MRTRILILAFLLSLVATPAFAQDIIVRGEAEVKRAPEIARLEVNIESRATTAEEARGLLAKTEIAVMKACSGLPSVEAKTNEYGVGANYERDNQGNRTKQSGYMAKMTIGLAVNDLARLPAVLKMGEIKGVMNLTGLRFDVKDRNAARNEALLLALAEARTKAANLAKAFGKRASFIKVQEGGAEFSDPFYMREGEEGASHLTFGVAGSVGALLASDQPEVVIIPAAIRISASVIILARAEQ